MRARQHILGYSTATVSSIPGAAFCRLHTDTPFGSVGSLSRTATMADAGEAGEDEIQFLRTVSAFLSVYTVVICRCDTAVGSVVDLSASR